MGFTFSAIATSQTFSKDHMDSFSVRFQCPKLKFEREVNFEEAMDINFDDEYIDVLFLEKGTFVFTSNPDVGNKLNIKRNSFQHKAGAFSVNETSMVFMIEYFENYELKKSFVEYNLEEQENVDNDLEMEYTDGLDLSFKLIEKITSESFYKHEPDAKMSRYRFVKGTPEVNNEDRLWFTIMVMKTKDPELREQVLGSSTETKTEKTQQKVTGELKKWWEFWK